MASPPPSGAGGPASPLPTRDANAPAAPATPTFFREILAFPYVEGFAFVARARGVGTWATVDAIWARPPESTAQILHPETYDRREGPAAIEAAPLAALAPALRPLRADTLGEAAIRAWLAEAAPPEIAARAAAGWRGDRVAVYVAATGAATGESSAAGNLPAAAGAGRAVLAWLTVWISPADADDFERAALPRLADLASPRADHADVAPPPAADRPVVLKDAQSGEAFAAQRRGTRVALVMGAPAAAAAPALAEMLDAWSVRVPPPPAPMAPPAPAPQPAERLAPPRPRR
jgi:hypothetical protein